MIGFGVQQGWQCPVCNRVNAPWMPFCGCATSGTVSGTTFSIAPQCDCGAQTGMHVRGAGCKDAWVK